MLRKLLIFLVGLLLLAGLSACASQPGTGSATAPEAGSAPGFKDITADELKQMLENKDFFLVDVHVPEQKHIAGTDAFVPFNEIEKNLGKFPADKDKKIVIYCRSGSMSRESSTELIRLGYKQVYNLDGGIYAWKDAGYPVE